MIHIANLTKTYPTKNGAFKALDDVTLHIERGEIFGIIGPSGAGKSTLVQCINFLERPDSGTIKFNGKMLQNLQEAELRAHRRRIGMIFQSFNLLSRRTVAENVALPLEIIGSSASKNSPRVHELLQLVGLEHLHDRYPHQLSGGQKQRVGIARALAAKPDLILSDEATSALDPETTASILALLKDIQQKTGVTIIMITHQMEVVKAICDKVAVISGGTILEQGKTADVFSNPQQTITETMIAASMASELSAETLLSEKQKPVFTSESATSYIWKIKINGSVSSESILSTLQKLEVNYRIIQAKIENIKGLAIGTLFLHVQGLDMQMQAAQQYLNTHHIQHEEIVA